MTKSAESKKRPFKDFLAGYMGGIFIVGVGHPFDTLKVRMQTSQENVNIFQMIKRTARHGPLEFYKGAASPLIGVSARHAVLLFCYGSIYTHLFHANSPSELPLNKVFMSGALAGIGNAMVEGPVDLLKAKVQMQFGKGGQYSGSIDCGRHLVRQYGLRGLYQAQIAVWARNIPANGVYFCTYEFFKRFFQGEDRSARLSEWQTFICGGMAGLFYWIGCYPLDVVKSAMQTDHSDPTKRQYRSFPDCVRQIYQKKGLGGFTRGITPCLLRSFPANGAAFIGIELAWKIMDFFDP